MTTQPLRTTAQGVVLAGALVLAACAGSDPSSSPSGSTAPTAIPSPTAAATPRADTAGPHPALVIDLGEGVAPVDVITAFGSVWVANHRDDTVVRINPDTGMTEARIHLNFSGPGWFAITDDAVWVTRQTGDGMAQIDPATNEVIDEQVGFAQPCWRPAAGLGAVWYYSCDRGQMIRIDLATSEVTEIEAPDMSAPIIVGEVLYAAGPDGMMRLAEDGTTWVPIGGCCGTLIGFAGGTFWLVDGDEIHRVDLATGAVSATIPIRGGDSMTADAETVWLVPAEGVSGPLRQIRIADNAILDDLPVGTSPIAAHADGPTLWVTSFDASELWRVDLGE